MLNLLKLELRKLKTSKMFYFFICLNILQAVPIYMYSARLSAYSGKDSLNYMFFLQLSLSFGITIGVFIVDLVCNEFSSGYIKNLISYGHKRIDIFIAKAITAYIGVCILTIAAPLIIMAINCYKNGFGEIFTSNSFLYIAGILLKALLAHIAIASISVFVSFTVRKQITGFILVIILDFMNRAINIAYVQIPNMRLVLDKYPYMQLYSFFSDEIHYNQSIQSMAIFLVTVLICTFLGIYIFNRSDIK